MDAPLVMTLFLKPDEVDKEAMNVDSGEPYPLEFYESADRKEKPSSIEKIMGQMKNMVEKNGTVIGMKYMFSTTDLNQGVLLSSYKKLGTMSEKIREQLDLARAIRAVDANDVAERLINSHFLPDMFGNFRGFFSQEFRCTKCSTKFRRIPLSGKCTKCRFPCSRWPRYKYCIFQFLKKIPSKDHRWADGCTTGHDTFPET